MISDPKKEARFNDSARVTIRNGPGGKRYIRGYALKYNVLSQLLFGEFRERILDGALDDCDLSDVACTMNHDKDLLLGMNQSGTLRLERDVIGLYYEVIPPNTKAGNSAMELVSRGDISGSSFIFEVADDGEKWEKEGNYLVRTILKIKKIWEVGPVVQMLPCET